MLVPAATALVYREWRPLQSVLIVMALCLALGMLMKWRKPQNTTLYAREGLVIVSSSWIMLSIMGALPFFLSGAIPSYIDALFETVSGLTTTGSSILTDVEALPKCLIMWRSFTNWIGGMGVLVFIMAFVSLSGGQNMHIMKAESPGPSVSKLVPRVRTTAAILYSIYLGMTVIQFIMHLLPTLWGDGMTVFEAMNTAFATAGTGGFGFRNDSFASFSAYHQIVVTVFMLLFSINFGCYYLILVRRFKEAFNVELRYFLVIVAAAIAIITANTVTSGIYDSVGEALRHAAFSVATVVSTSGFATADFNLWPSLSTTILVTLMFMGACAGSTGGGIKVSRIILMLRGAGREIGNMIHPRRVKRVSVDGKPVEHDAVHAVFMYLVAFAFVFFASFLIISIDGHSFETNFTAVAATINNIGPGLGDVGPTGNFAFFSIPSKIVLMFNMLAGRLELFPMLVLLSPMTWKK